MMSPQQERFYVDRLRVPIGTMLVVTSSDGCVRALDWEEYESRMHRLLRLHYRHGAVTLTSRSMPQVVRAALIGYFDGTLSALSDIDVRTGGTEFQQSVWATLRTIPTGETRTYAELAEAIGRPRAVRAVGLANGANPIGVIVPCHRVIGKSGRLTGYAGGLERKRWLLDHERTPRQASGARA